MTDAGILAPRPLPDGPLIAFYGDDFTGSSAVMEVTAFAGLPTVLFLKPPSPARLAAFRHYRVIGVAGTARSQSPAWMEAHLPAVFDALAELGTPIVHYKVCSTFDSSPEIGSIGRAADIAARRFPGWTPLIVADPGMQRFQAFGHLFARLGAEVHRLDRHPTMSLHPVTPMDEAISAAISPVRPVAEFGLVDLAAMKRGVAEARLAQELAAGAAIVSLDVIDRATLVAAAGWSGSRAPGRPSRSAPRRASRRRSSPGGGRRGLLLAEPPRRRFGAVDRLACASGSVRPVTADQIAHAQAHGFAAIRLHAARLVDAAALASEVEKGRRRDAASPRRGPRRHRVQCGGCGRSRGRRPADGGRDGGRPDRDRQRTHWHGPRPDPRAHRADRAPVARRRLRRRHLGPRRLGARHRCPDGHRAARARRPAVPGAVRAPGIRRGLELALKGGQVGGPDFFVAAKTGPMP